MSDKDYEEYLRLFEKEYPTVTDTFEQKRRTGNRSGKNVSPTNQSVSKNRKNSKSRKAGKYRQRKNMIVSGSVLVLIILITVIAVLCKSCFGAGNDLSVLQGTWYYDQYTEYEFDGNGGGCMCIDGTAHYEFTYTIKGDTLKIDFVLDYVTDCEYGFVLKNDKLTLVGGTGTANPGQVYTLERLQS